MFNFHLTYNDVNQEKTKCSQNEITCKHTLCVKVTYKPVKKRNLKAIVQNSLGKKFNRNISVRCIPLDFYTPLCLNNFRLILKELGTCSPLKKIKIKNKNVVSVLVQVNQCQKWPKQTVRQSRLSQLSHTLQTWNTAHRPLGSVYESFPNCRPIGTSAAPLLVFKL